MQLHQDKIAAQLYDLTHHIATMLYLLVLKQAYKFLHLLEAPFSYLIIRLYR